MDYNAQMKSVPIGLAYVLPRLRDLLFCIVLAMVILWGPALLNRDTDLALHITIGNHIIDSGSIPTKDIFSHTMYGTRFVPHEWLAEVAFALAYRFMGLGGDLYLTALLAAITILLVYEELVRRGALRPVAVLVTLWATLVAFVHLSPRPHMFTLLYVVLWTYGLERMYNERQYKLWPFPLLMWLWANTHGAFFAGFVIWGTYLADWFFAYRQGTGTKEMGKRLAWIGLSAFIVTFANPSGIYLWTTTVSFVSNNNLTIRVLEWLSPDFHSWATSWPFLFMIAFALFSLAQKRTIYFREALLLSGWAVLGLYSIRNSPLFAVITAPIYGGLIQSWATRIAPLRKLDSILSETEKALRGYLWIVLPALVAGYLVWSGWPANTNRTGYAFSPIKMPVQAMDWLQENPQQGKMFNDYIWGSYMLFRLWPEQTVFIDTRTDFYGEDMILEYLDVVSLSDGWEDVLDKYSISWMLLPREEMLAGQLYTVGSDIWEVVYEDGIAVIFRRNLPASPP